MKFEAATLLAWMIALNGMTVLLLISSGFVRVMRRRPAADAPATEGLAKFEDEAVEAESAGDTELVTETPPVPDVAVDSDRPRRRGEERLASNLRDWGGGDAGGEVLPLAAELCRGARRGVVTEHLV